MNIAAYSHKSNGIVERYNQTLIGRIRRMMSHEGHKDWSKVLWKAATIINDTPHSVIKETPKKVWEGSKELWEKCKLRTKVARQNYNRRLKGRKGNWQYFRGQKVWVYDHIRSQRLDRKFEPFWTGPWVLDKKISRVLWEVSSEKGERKLVHSDDLQMFC